MIQLYFYLLFFTLSTAAITFRTSSLVRLRVSARPDRDIFIFWSPCFILFYFFEFIKFWKQIWLPPRVLYQNFDQNILNLTLEVFSSKIASVGKDIEMVQSNNWLNFQRFLAMQLSINNMTRRKKVRRNQSKTFSYPLLFNVSFILRMSTK